ncbi:MAG: response regulator [Clostridia bacterium]|nr:response regulator [Clostridia bacterium]
MIGKVMLVDDDRVLASFLTDQLAKDGFEVRYFTSGEDALEEVFSVRPDIIILDFVLPGINGLELCRVLRNDTRTSHLPIIMLTSRDNIEDKVAGLEAGADDYITKPFDYVELLARVKSQLRRARQEKLYNPLTGLPGNKLIEEELTKASKNNLPYAVLYVDVDNFKPYNDLYGFLRGDEVIKVLAEIVQQAVAERGNSTDFIGHIGGDDFIILTTPERVEQISSQIISRFTELVPKFYLPEHRLVRSIPGIDRQGREVKFPLMTISIAVLKSKGQPVRGAREIAALAAEGKKAAKSKPGSVWVINKMH